MAVEELQNALKAELLALSLSDAGPILVKDRASMILKDYLGDRGNVSVGVKTGQLSQDLSEIVLGLNTRKSQDQPTLSTKASDDVHRSRSRNDIGLVQTK